MNAIFSYNPETKRYTMQWENKIIVFLYDEKRASVTKSWDENDRLIARSYKGLRDKLNIVTGSKKAEFATMFRQCPTLSAKTK